MRSLLILGMGIVLLGGLSGCGQSDPAPIVCTPVIYNPELSVSSAQVRVGEAVTMTVTVPKPGTCGSYPTSRVAFHVNNQGFKTVAYEQDTPTVFQATWTPKIGEFGLSSSGVVNVPIYARADTEFGQMWAYPKSDQGNGFPPAAVVQVQIP